MSLFDWLKDLLGGAGDHVQNISDTVQGIGDSEIAQNVQDKASELGTQAEELTGRLGEQAQGVIDGLKDKLPK